MGDDIGVNIVGRLVYVGDSVGSYTYSDLTVGRIYDVIESYVDGYVCVINDCGENV